MPLDPPPAWGQAVADAISGMNIDNSAPITPQQLAQIWIMIKTEDHTQLTQNAQAMGVVTSGAGSGGGVLVTPGGIS